MVVQWVRMVVGEPAASKPKPHRCKFVDEYDERTSRVLHQAIENTLELIGKHKSITTKSQRSSGYGQALHGGI